MRSLLPNTAVIIPAAGSGERFGASIPKALVQLVGRTLIERAVTNLSPIASQVIVAAPAAYVNQIRTFFGDSVQVIPGGETRTQSIRLALELVSIDTKYILVHDAARPLASTELATRIINELESGADGVIPVLTINDTIKKINKSGFVVKTPNRSKLRAVQTPQGFRRGVLLGAYGLGIEGTDDASLVEEFGKEVKTIPGEIAALKITSPEDLATATKLLIGSQGQDLRIGVGSDAHAFSTDSSRELWLAGLLWDGVGLAGHSDGDVAIHAICDSLFSASGLGDLGSNFGTDQPQYAGASGAVLLKETLQRIQVAGFKAQNVSVQIIGNSPKIGARRSEAITTLSQLLGGVAVAVTATTTDGLGLTGEGKGIGAIATALVVRINP